jgi:hypothetical protein
MPISMYYSRYIRHRFFFLGYLGNYFEPKHFYTSTILDHLLFPGDFDFFYNFRIPINFGVIGC